MRTRSRSGAPRSGSGDAGTTLVELMVTGMLAVGLSVVFGVAVRPFQSTVAAQTSASTAAQNLRTAVLTLDKQVRWAGAVNTPGTANGAQYVEYEWQQVTPSGTTAGALTPRCSQWRATASGQLQEREWSPTSTVTFSSLPWKTVATGLSTPPSTTSPFALVSDVTNLTTQQLTVTLALAMGRTSATGSAQVTLTALNSPSNAAPSPAVCSAPTSRTP